ncbi:MAG: sensor histidine kinase [Rubrivivax sp.]|nr:sensor histidine kinase [Rubrivivax sp.]
MAERAGRAPPPSLRQRLLRGLLLPLVIGVPAAGWWQMQTVRAPAQAAFDLALGNAAIALSTFIKTDAEGHVLFELDPLAERALRTDQFDSISYAVIGPDGQRMAGDAPLAQDAPPLLPEAWRHDDGRVDGTEVRIVRRGVACGNAVCQVVVAQTTLRRDQVLRETLLGVLAAVLALAAAAVVTVWWATRRALQPLDRLGQQLTSRSIDDLRPVQADDAPAEAQPLVTALNAMLQRVQGGAQQQQAFLADAAHQLRTPLAVLQAEADLALAQPHPEALAPTLQRLAGGAARASRMAGQLLALARSERTARMAVPLEPTDLQRLAAEAAETWVPRALQQGVDLGFELQPAPLLGRAFLLRELLANLIDNAIVHAGPGACVTVRTGQTGESCWLEVEDDGPGLPPELRAAVFDRFVRGPQAPAGGSGLGLAIVHDIALGHGGQVQWLDPQGSPGQAGPRGALLRVTLPVRPLGEGDAGQGGSALESSPRTAAKAAPAQERQP